MWSPPPLGGSVLFWGPAGSSKYQCEFKSKSVILWLTTMCTNARSSEWFLLRWRLHLIYVSLLQLWFLYLSSKAFFSQIWLSAHCVLAHLSLVRVSVILKLVAFLSLRLKVEPAHRDWHFVLFCKELMDLISRCSDNLAKLGRSQ